MANNLKDHLKEEADAIRAKKGTSDLINPQDFATEIEGISGSGESGGSTIEYLDVSGVEDKTIVFEWATSARLVVPQYATIVAPVGRMVETITNVGYGYVEAISVYTSSMVAMRQGEDAISITMAEYISMSGNSELFDSIPRLTKEQFYNLNA